jgi:hypothetical protein
MNLPNHNHSEYCFDQIDGFFCDLLTDEKLTGAEVALGFNKMFAEWEDYHLKQLTKIREIRAAMFKSPLQLQQDDNREFLYEEIKKSHKTDIS